jgi:hypothetical protein
MGAGYRQTDSRCCRWVTSRNRRLPRVLSADDRAAWIGGKRAAKISVEEARCDRPSRSAVGLDASKKQWVGAQVRLLAAPSGCECNQATWRRPIVCCSVWATEQHQIGHAARWKRAGLFRRGADQRRFRPSLSRPSYLQVGGGFRVAAACKSWLKTNSRPCPREWCWRRSSLSVRYKHPLTTFSLPARTGDTLS